MKLKSQAQHNDELNQSAEAFLLFILQTHFKHAVNDPMLFRFDFSDTETSKLLERFEQFYSKGEIEQYDKEVFEKRLKEIIAEGTILTPIFRGKNKNVLGKIHDSVLLMVKDQYPELTRIPIAIAKENMIHGRLFRNYNGDMAIVLSLGYFNVLYSINRIMELVTESHHLHDEKRIQMLFQMLCLISHHLGKKTLNKPSYTPDYSNQEEFERIHIITSSQQQFVLFHEFGHAAEMLETPIVNGSAYTEWEGNLEKDLRADEWASRLIVEKGENFYIPWVQLRSIFWLFEYIHLVEVFEEKKGADQQTARFRFNKISEIIDPHHKLLPPQAIQDLRDNFDLIYNHFDILFMSLVKNI